MKKTLAFLMLMLASQMAIADFLWPKGNDLTAKIHSATAWENMLYDAEKTEAILSNNDSMILKLNFKKDRRDVVLEIWGDSYNCHRQDMQGHKDMYICPKPDYRIQINLYQRFRVITGVQINIAPWEDQWGGMFEPFRIGLEASITK